MSRFISVIILAWSSALFSNPYPDPNKVPWDVVVASAPSFQPILSTDHVRKLAHSVLRVDVEWSSENDEFAFSKALREQSGTAALLKRATHRDLLGSYHGELWSVKENAPIYFDSVGTGQMFRKLTRALSFRFPLVDFDVEFRLYAENPDSGVEELVLRQHLSPSDFQPSHSDFQPEVRILKVSNHANPLMLNIYAEGYLKDRQAQFFADAEKAVNALKTSQFPLLDKFEIKAVFSPSNLEIGKAQDHGNVVKIQDSFLGLYYPYWNKFGRWYHVVYPTSESKYRDAIASVAYDYAFALVDNADYWGVGNFNELTAIPSRNYAFTYLLLHEFGHFFGLNEEYEGGGITELAFAPHINEPWSQNITFHPQNEELKWKKFVAQSTPTPTKPSLWNGQGPYGAYLGGYADTPPLHQSHKPGMGCMMSSGKSFCPICKHAIEKKIEFDLGN